MFYKILYLKNYVFVDYDNVEYRDYNECYKIWEDAQEQFPNITFLIWGIYG